MEAVSEAKVANWLTRLGLPSDLPATHDSLTAITHAHLDRIPFENLSVFCGAVPDLGLEALSDKMIHHRRGGYCFEVNTLLCAGLRGLGFDARLRMARVMWQRKVPGPRTHCVCLVALEGAEYLVDVGFGGPGPTAPVRLDVEAADLRTEQRAGLGTVLSRRTDSGDWADLYAFAEEPTALSDLEAGNWLAATLPGSLFARTLVVTRHSGDTRWVLEGTRFRKFAKGRAPEVADLQTPGAVLACLQDVFGLDPPPELAGAMIRKELL